MKTQDGVTLDVNKAEKAGLSLLFISSLPMSSMPAYTDTWYLTFIHQLLVQLMADSPEKFAFLRKLQTTRILWEGVRDQGNKGNFVVSVYYRPPNQGKPIDEAFLFQLQ